MLSLAILQTALSSISTTFGSLGVFFVFRSFEVPRLGLQGLLFLGAATVIALAQKKPEKK